jgi:hypothetical protein
VSSSSSDVDAAIDTYTLLTALKGTGKSANYSAEEIASAIHAAQAGTELLTRRAFEERMTAFEARFDAKLAMLEAKLESFRADIKAEVKAGQLQNLMWLSGIVLTSNGIVIALLARLAHVV